MKKLLLLSLLLLLITSMPAARKALLIGNAAYSSRTLKNPVNDASDLEAALKDLGFATTLIKDADYRDMYKGIENFTDGLVYGDEAIFYFSGHGVQIADNNYLLPIGDRKLTDKIDFDTYAISATWTLGKLAKARVSVMILDACRDNPTVSRSVAGKKGLAKLEPESGSQYVIYATEKDTEASDGEGRNSPFAQSLLRHIKSPVSVGEELMRLIRSDVKKATNNQQIPTAYGMLDEPYYLVAPASQPTERVVQTPSQPQAQVIVSYGTILVSGNLEGELWLDGSRQGKLPANSQMRISNVQTGSHVLEFKAQGDSKRQTVTIQPGQEHSVRFDIASQALASLREDLLAYWNFNEREGTKILDQSGNGYHFDFTGGGGFESQFSWTDGHIDGGLTRNSKGDMLSFMKSSSFDQEVLPRQDFTYNMWIKGNLRSVSNHVYLFLWSSLYSAYFRISPPNMPRDYYCTVSSYAWASTSEGDFAFNAQSRDLLIMDNQWHMLTLTRRKSMSVQDVTLYFDGRPISSYLYRSNTNKDVIKRDGFLGLGGGNQGSQMLFSKGCYDAAGIWERDLTEEEVILLYNSGAGIEYPF